MALHIRRVSLSLRADQRRRQSPPVGVEAVDVADVVAAGALCDRQPERAGVRRAVLCESGDARWHAGDVVHRGAGAGMGAVAGVRQAGLALRRAAGRLRRGVPAVVRRHRPADVLLLRGDDGAVPGVDDRDDSRRHLAQAEPECGATNAGPDRRVLLYRACDYELRVDVSDPDGSAHLAGDVEHADLASVLALNFALMAVVR